MQYKGVLRKMKTELTSQVQYFMEFEEDFIHMNQLLNREVGITFIGYQCLNCGKDKKIYR